MGIARNIARLVPNGSGLLPNANIEAVAASKLTGQVADANAPSGSVIQVVYQQAGGSSITSTSGDLTMLTSAITPTSASNKILAIMSVVTERTGGGSSGNYVFISLKRGATVIEANWANALGYQLTTGARGVGAHAILDSPASTSAVTYTFSGNFTSSGNVQWDFYELQLTLLEIAA
jgi:hypothetical protein